MFADTTGLSRYSWLQLCLIETVKLNSLLSLLCITYIVGGCRGWMVDLWLVHHSYLASIQLWKKWTSVWKYADWSFGARLAWLLLLPPLPVLWYEGPLNRAGPSLSLRPSLLIKYALTLDTHSFYKLRCNNFARLF